MGRFGKLGRINEAIENGGPTLVKEYSGLSMALQFKPARWDPVYSTKSSSAPICWRRSSRRTIPPSRWARIPGPGGLPVSEGVPADYAVIHAQLWMRRETSSSMGHLGPGDGESG
jgi:hypothetical protein